MTTVTFILIAGGIVGLAALIAIIAGIAGLVQGFTPAGALSLLFGTIVLVVIVAPFAIGADLTSFTSQVTPPLSPPAD